MAVIHIDGTTVEVDSSDNLQQACLSPALMCRIFVIIPPLAPVGSCRQCAVKFQNADDMKAGRGRLGCPVWSHLIMTCTSRSMMMKPKRFVSRWLSYSWPTIRMIAQLVEEGGHCHFAGHDLYVRSQPSSLSLYQTYPSQPRAWYL